MKGYFLMDRGWQDHPLFRSEAFSKRDAWAWMVEQAAFADHDVERGDKIISLKRGQFCQSLRYMAKAWRWDEKKVRRFLASAEKWSKIAAATAAGWSVITICEYDEIQRGEEELAAPSGYQPPQERRTTAANKKQGKLRETNENEDPGSGDSAGVDRHLVFVGDVVVRLNQRDFDRWRSKYHLIPDLVAELWSIDSWWAGKSDVERKRWFVATERMLNRKHQDLAERQSNVVPIGGRAPTDPNQIMDEQLRRDRAEDEAMRLRRES